MVIHNIMHTYVPKCLITALLKLSAKFHQRFIARIIHQHSHSIVNPAFHVITLDFSITKGYVFWLRNTKTFWGGGGHAPDP